jgi:hypothetical protein
MKHFHSHQANWRYPTASRLWPADFWIGVAAARLFEPCLCNMGLGYFCAAKSGAVASAQNQSQRLVGPAKGCCMKPPAVALASTGVTQQPNTYSHGTARPSRGWTAFSSHISNALIPLSVETGIFPKDRLFTTRDLFRGTHKSRHP